MSVAFRMCTVQWVSLSLYLCVGALQCSEHGLLTKSLECSGSTFWTPSIPACLVLELQRPVNCSGSPKDKSHIQFLLHHFKSYNKKPKHPPIYQCTMTYVLVPIYFPYTHRRNLLQLLVIISRLTYLSHKIKLVLFPLASGKPSMPDTVDSTVAFIFYIFFFKLDFVFDSLKWYI